MAELEYGNRDNLFNRQKASDPGGGLLDMTLNLTENNHLVTDLPAAPANKTLAQVGVRWESIPSGTFVPLGGGWTASYGRLQPYVEALGILRSRYQVPVDVAMAEADPDEYMLGQEKAHQEGMSQSAANSLIFGSRATAPEKINGLSSRAPWNDVSETDYVYDMGGSSNLRSAWLINPGMSRVHLLYPKYHASKGVVREHMGKVFVDATDTDANASGKRWDYVTEFSWQYGLCIRDQRAVKRIPNIDSSLSAISTTLIHKIHQARLLHEIGGTWFLYCDAKVYTQMLILAEDKQNVRYSPDNPYRVSLPMVGDVIIRRMDALNDDTNEVLVT